MNELQGFVQRHVFATVLDSLHNKSLLESESTEKDECIKQAISACVGKAFEQYQAKGGQEEGCATAFQITEADTSRCCDSIEQHQSSQPSPTESIVSMTSQEDILSYAPCSRPTGFYECSQYYSGASEWEEDTEITQPSVEPTFELMSPYQFDIVSTSNSAVTSRFQADGRASIKSIGSHVGVPPSNALLKQTGLQDFNMDAAIYDTNDYTMKHESMQHTVWNPFPIIEMDNETGNFQ